MREPDGHHRVDLRWIYTALVVVIILFFVSASANLFTLFSEHQDVRAVACSNARALFIQDEYAIYSIHTRSNTRFFRALEREIPTTRCDETRHALRMEAQQLINQTGGRTP
jgi:hypothetical protein